MLFDDKGESWRGGSLGLMRALHSAIGGEELVRYTVVNMSELRWLRKSIPITPAWPTLYGSFTFSSSETSRGSASRGTEIPDALEEVGGFSENSVIRVTGFFGSVKSPKPPAHLLSSLTSEAMRPPCGRRARAS